MEAKIFILAFAAVIWQAKSQSCGPTLPGIPKVSLTSGDGTAPIQTSLSGVNCAPLNFGIRGLQRSYNAALPTTSISSKNSCSETESPDLLRATSTGSSRYGAIPNVPILGETSPRSFGSCVPTITPENAQVYQLNEEISRPTASSDSCLGPIYSMTPKIPSSRFGFNKVSQNFFGNLNNIPNPVTMDTLASVEARRQVSNLGRLNGASSNVHATTTTETTTTMTSNAGSPFGGTSTITTADEESSTAVNVRANNYDPTLNRVFNNNQQGSLSCSANSKAGPLVTLPGTYSANELENKIAPTQTTIATAESKSIATSNLGPSRAFPANLNTDFNTLSSTVSSAASSQTNVPGSSIYRGHINSAETTANTDVSSSVIPRSPSIRTPNYFENINSLSPTSISTQGSSEASAFTTTRQPAIFNYGYLSPQFSAIQTSANAETEISSNIVFPKNYISNTFPVSAATCSDASFPNTAPSKIFSPNLPGLNNIAQPIVSSAGNSKTNVFNSLVNSGSLNSGQSNANTECTSSVNSRHPSVCIPNYYGGINNLGQTSVSTEASSEASAFASTRSPNIYTSRLPGFQTSAFQTSANAEAEMSSLVAKPNIYVSSSTPVSTAACSDTSLTNIFLPKNNFAALDNNAQPTLASVANSETFSSTQIGSSLPTGSSTATASATEVVNSTKHANSNLPFMYQPHYATELSNVEATSSCNFNPAVYGATTLNPTSVAASEAISSKRAVNSFVPYIYQPPYATSVTKAEATSIANAGSGLGPNAYEVLTSNPASIISTASAEDSSLTRSSNVNSLASALNNLDLQSNTAPTVANSEASSFVSTGSSHLHRPFYPMVSNYGFNNYPVFPVNAAESLDAEKIIPLNEVPPNFCGSIPQTACLSKPPISPAYIEHPLFNINPYSQGYNQFSPQPEHEIIQPSYLSSFNPIVTSLNELSESIRSIGLGPVYSLGQVSSSELLGSEASSSAVAFADNTSETSSSASSAEASISIEPITASVPQEVTTTTTTSSSSTSSTVSDINNPLTLCDDAGIISSATSTSSASAVEEIIPIVHNAEVLQDTPASSSVAVANDISSALATASSTSAVSVSSTSSSVLPESPCTILPPVTLEVQIPSSIASSISTNLCGSFTGWPASTASYIPGSSSPVVYELQIPASIPAQLSCSLGSVPTTQPVLCMNVEPFGMHYY